MFKNVYAAVMLLGFVAGNAVLFLVTGTKHNLDFWVSYAFVVFAYITLWFSPFRQDDSSMEYLFALTRMRINVFYVIAALAAAILVNTYLTEKMYVYGIQIAVAVVFIALMLFIADIDEDHAAKEQKHKERRAFRSEIQPRLKVLMVKNQDPALGRKYDLLMDMVTALTETKHPGCMECEDRFLRLLGELEEARNNEIEIKISLADKLIETLKIRNQMLS